MDNLIEVPDLEFYSRPTLAVARDLLGCKLWRRTADNQLVSAVIVETEAYTEDDPACHAYRGITERCRVLFGPPGRAYVYFIYGMYHCFNVVTEPDKTPGAVLVRALDMEGGNGPGKLCRTWNIDRSHNDIDLTDRDSMLFISRHTDFSDSAVAVSTRIGLNVAADRLWRFYVDKHPYVSGKRHGQVIAAPARSAKIKVAAGAAKSRKKS
ncbi:MAG TPA: DNA-3-methyladenine glycosylase [Chroococcales cyanobacterium]